MSLNFYKNSNGHISEPVDSLSAVQINFQLHSTVKAFVVVQYLENGKNRKFEKTKNRKNGSKWPKIVKRSTFFLCALSSLKKEKKISVLDLNSDRRFLRNCD